MNEDSKEFKWDSDKKLMDLARDYVKHNRNKNLVSISFMYNGKILPSHKTFRELGIDPENERITIMATHSGEPQ
ncbi:hypothetical protein LCGC14_2086870 [marine sediment metagenome]|uniref:Ubiquitin-like domain-containing protein n=1 Tax=marine sediment metagenome TaxID=412755 RepID=A0A0F9HAX4_9ZZZZ